MEEKRKEKKQEVQWYMLKMWGQKITLHTETEDIGNDQFEGSIKMITYIKSFQFSLFELCQEQVLSHLWLAEK